MLVKRPYVDGVSLLHLRKTYSMLVKRPYVDGVS